MSEKFRAPTGFHPDLNLTSLLPSHSSSNMQAQKQLRCYFRIVLLPELAV